MYLYIVKCFIYLTHWVSYAISLAYEVRGLSPPLGIRAHSTRGWPPPKLCLEGVPLEDICMAAGWSFAHTFVRFYNQDVNKTPGSQVLSV